MKILQKWGLQQSGKLRPQEMKKMTWEISVIYLEAREECSKLVCNRRASQGSRWTR
jgi:hypothetical protein